MLFKWHTQADLDLSEVMPNLLYCVWTYVFALDFWEIITEFGKTVYISSQQNKYFMISSTRYQGHYWTFDQDHSYYNE